VDPNEGGRGQTLTLVNITGSGFADLENVSFGAGITVNSYTNVSATLISANITIDAAAATGWRGVTVWNAYGNATLTEGFYVPQEGEIKNPKVVSQFLGTVETLGNITTVEVGCGKLLETKEYSLVDRYSKWLEYQQFTGGAWVTKTWSLGVYETVPITFSTQKVISGSTPSYVGMIQDLTVIQIETASEWEAIHSGVECAGYGLKADWVEYERTVTVKTWQSFSNCTGTAWVTQESMPVYTQRVETKTVYTDPYPSGVWDVEDNENVVMSDWEAIDSWVVYQGDGTCIRFTEERQATTTETWQTWMICAGEGTSEMVEGAHIFITTYAYRTIESDPYSCPSPGGGGAS